MLKTLKITENTHNRLRSVGKIGDTFEDAIKSLLDDFETTILRVKIVGNQRDVFIRNPLYSWTDENYDAFLNIVNDSSMYGGEWGKNF
jgi:hypothetical protein